MSTPFLKLIIHMSLPVCCFHTANSVRKISNTITSSCRNLLPDYKKTELDSVKLKSSSVSVKLCLVAGLLHTQRFYNAFHITLFRLVFILLSTSGSIPSCQLLSLCSKLHSQSLSNPSHTCLLQTANRHCSIPCPASP